LKVRKYFLGPPPSPHFSEIEKTIISKCQLDIEIDMDIDINIDMDMDMDIDRL